MPVKKDKKITKKPVKKSKTPAKGKTQTQKSKTQTQTQSIVVNIGRRSSSKGKQVTSKVPSANYQASESPYPSYVRQSAVFPVQQNEPVFNTVGQTVGPIPNRIPVFADTPQQPTAMPEEETFIRPPINRNRIPKAKERNEQPTMIEENEEETFIRPPMPEELPSEVMLQPDDLPELGFMMKPQRKSKPGKQASPIRMPKLPSETPPRKAPEGSRRDLKERYYNLTGNTWQDVSKRKEKANTDELRGIVKDLEAGVAR
jgi:hypothetical protein